MADPKFNNPDLNSAYRLGKDRGYNAGFKFGLFLGIFAFFAGQIIAQYLAH